MQQIMHSIGSGGSELTEVVSAFLTRVGAIFDAQLESDLAPVAVLVKHVEAYRGKMLRPTLVGLCGLATRPNAELTREHAVVGAVCEMVHMATLVHDDVLDDAETRRKGLTVNRLRGNEPAVILGDLLIASAYHLCSQLQDQRAALAVGHASMVMCTGELLQLHHRDDFALDEKTYFEIVGRKTAALIATACELGAARSGGDQASCARLAGYGRKLGVAFQIQDDVLDLTGEEEVVGKTLGKDLEKGKLTLPLIHHLASVSGKERGKSLLLLEEACEGHEKSADAAATLRSAVVDTGSLDYARSVALRLVSEAKAEIAPIEQSAAKAGLLAAADAVVNRSL
ncbi:MAG: polyprenyl synthetase family protein [Phycisphaeraceae bacterium]|nr:polyprenyl synthetase family protein [Phycisphaeraceae bacterium]